MAAVGSVPIFRMASQSGGHESSTTTNCSSVFLDTAAAGISVIDVSDYLMFDHQASSSSALVDSSSDQAMADAVPLSHHDQNISNLNQVSVAEARARSTDGNMQGAIRREDNSRIAFRMKSEVEVLDDGFKWRKYGKKSVKNSPNPRNYYRCSTEGCSVKKIVERDREDPSYVITTYDGIHNHMSPGAVYYTSQDTVSGCFYVAGCQMPPPPPPPPPPPFS